MKKIIITLVLFFSIVNAEQKAVFDCAAKDMNVVNSRMWLIDVTAKELKKKKMPYDFVLTIHSKCTPIVAKSEDKTIKAIQKKLKKLHQEHNVKIEACGIAVNRFGYEKEELLPFVNLVDNSITRVISLQNNGYAFIPYH